MAHSPFKGWRKALAHCASFLVLLTVGALAAEKPPAPVADHADTPFALKASGGRYRRYRLAIPAEATAVRVKVVIEESFFDQRWASVTSFGLGPRDADDPDRTDVFARLGIWEDVNATYVRIRSEKSKREISMTEKLVPQSVWTWTAEWAGKERILRLNERLLTTDPQTEKPAILHLSVSGMRVNIAEITFTPPSPAPASPPPEGP